jgi:hypothetical protein
MGLSPLTTFDERCGLFKNRETKIPALITMFLIKKHGVINFGQTQATVQTGFGGKRLP